VRHVLPRLWKMWHLPWHANVSPRHRLTNRTELLCCWWHELRRRLRRNHWPKLHRHWWSKILWLSARTHHGRSGRLRQPRSLHITGHQATIKIPAKSRKSTSRDHSCSFSLPRSLVVDLVAGSKPDGAVGPNAGATGGARGDNYTRCVRWRETASFTGGGGATPATGEARLGRRGRSDPSLLGDACAR